MKWSNAPQRNTVLAELEHAHRQLDAARAELERVQAERDAAIRALKTSGAAFSYGNGPDMLARLANALDEYSNKLPCRQRISVRGWMEGWMLCLRNKAAAERAAIAAATGAGDE